MLPSEEALNRHQQHHFGNPTAALISQTSSNICNRKMNGSCVSTPSSSCNSVRRKSAFNYHHQLLNNNENVICETSDHHTTSTGGRYSPHPNELFLQHNAKLTLQPIPDDTLSCCLPPPSPAPHNDRFSSNTVTILPSNVGSDVSECFLSTHHHHHHHHHHQVQPSLSSSTSASSLSTNSGTGSQHNNISKFSIPSSLVAARPASPSSNRLRGADRFRDQHSIKSNSIMDNSVLRNVHHTPGKSSSISNDAYNYLNAPTAHTPIKRYIPTPPSSNDSYVPEATSTKCTVSTSAAAPQHLCTLPYRLRVKCCANDQSLFPQVTPQSTDHRPLSIADYYTTSPRTRSSGALIYNSKSNISTANCKDSPMHLPVQDEQQFHISNVGRSNCSYNTATSMTLGNTNPSNTLAIQSGPSSGCGRQSTAARSEYIGRTPSIEYININVAGASTTNASRVLSPVLMNANVEISQNSNNDSASSSSTGASTCLHCNTTRRTTGVHQTTQTTGPISPIPLQTHQQIGSTNLCLQDPPISSSSPITPATSETPLSPISTATVFDAQQLRLQQSSQTVTQVQEIHHNAENETTNDHNIICQQSHQPSTISNQHMPSSTTNNMPQTQRFNSTTRKKRLTQYLKREIARFFGVEASTEKEEFVLWRGRHRRLALRRFGTLKTEREFLGTSITEGGGDIRCQQNSHYSQYHNHSAPERPDILPAQDNANGNNYENHVNVNLSLDNVDFQAGDSIERKASVASMFSSGVTFIINAMSHNKSIRNTSRQWSRSFAPEHVRHPHPNSLSDDDELYEGLTSLEEDEVFFDSPNILENANNVASLGTSPIGQITTGDRINSKLNTSEQQRHQIYMGERVHGWRTTSLADSRNSITNQENTITQQNSGQQQQQSPAIPTPSINGGTRCTRISAQLLDGVLENSRRPLVHQTNQKLFTINDLDDRTDYRPFFTYWINTVQILVLFLSVICYGIGPIGFGIEQSTGQVLVTSLSLQTVQHSEQRNIWIGPRNYDLVHMGAKFATCMRRDVRILDVQFKTRRQERETACCIRNDDSGCVQSSQADCSVRGLFPTKSISTWKKWSPGESGPGGRISGSVCGLDPKYCDAPASVAPYEWPDDITKWPICRKANSFPQRFRFKDQTAEHMVCEVIGHPCCTGIFGECRITTREYCDFVNGYFHEEASLCSQISCLSNVCGMFPFFSVEIPDQFYRVFTSLCLHAGILHLAITVAFQHVFLADLERLIGPIRTAIVYIGSGVAGNLTSLLLVPYKPEVGPLASLSGVVASLTVLLVLAHWKQLRKPHMALIKLIFIGALLFGMGTLPWQLNFTGLLAGIVCGVFLTIAFVPFISFSTYARKSKITLIWSCVAFHVFLYSFMLVVFYIFPSELTNFNFGEVLTNTFNTNFGANANSGLGEGGINSESQMGAGVDVLSSISHMKQDQYIHHHHSNFMISNNAAALHVGTPYDRHNVTTYHRVYHNSKNSRRINSGYENNGNRNAVNNFKEIMLVNSARKHSSYKNSTRNSGKEYKNGTLSLLFDGIKTKDLSSNNQNLNKSLMQIHYNLSNIENYSNLLKRVEPSNKKTMASVINKTDSNRVIYSMAVNTVTGGATAEEAAIAASTAVNDQSLQ